MSPPLHGPAGPKSERMKRQPYARSREPDDLEGALIRNWSAWIAEPTIGQEAAYPWVGWPVGSGVAAKRRRTTRMVFSIGVDRSSDPQPQLVAVFDKALHAASETSPIHFTFRRPGTDIWSVRPQIGAEKGGVWHAIRRFFSPFSSSRLEAGILILTGIVLVFVASPVVNIVIGCVLLVLAMLLMMVGREPFEVLNRSGPLGRRRRGASDPSLAGDRELVLDALDTRVRLEIAQLASRALLPPGRVREALAALIGDGLAKETITQQGRPAYLRRLSVQ
jgi:hypothetical protein